MWYSQSPSSKFHFCKKNKDSERGIPVLVYSTALDQGQYATQNSWFNENSYTVFYMSFMVGQNFKGILKQIYHSFWYMCPQI